MRDRRSPGIMLASIKASSLLFHVGSKSLSSTHVDGSAQKRGSIASARGKTETRASGLQVRYELSQLIERSRVQRVVHPSPVLAIGDETRILEDLQVEREARLRRLERVGEVTHALLALAQQRDETKPRLVAQRMKPALSLCEIGRDERHGGRVYQDRLMRQGAGSSIILTIARNMAQARRAPRDELR